MLEVIIAIAVLILALIPVFTLMGSSNRTMAKAENNAVAYNLAMEALEWAKSSPFEKLRGDLVDRSDAQGFGFPVALDRPLKTQDGKQFQYPPNYFKYFSNFKREMTINDYGTKGDMKKVVVTVKWKEDAVDRSEVVSTLVVDTRFR